MTAPILVMLVHVLLRLRMNNSKVLFGSLCNGKRCVLIAATTPTNPKLPF